MVLVEIQNIVKSFGKFKALNDVSLTLDKAQSYAIKGPSGSGKSTLLYLLGGLDRATSGQIHVEGEELFKMNDANLSLYRNSYVGFVFQFHFLLPILNCLDNILLPAKIGNADLIKTKKNIMQLADYLKVEHCLKKYPPELSGGEQQRINIIRALSLRPKLLLCDEPTGNLDSENSLLVTKLLKTLATELESTLIVVTHDNKVSNQFESLITMQDGQIISSLPSVPPV